MPEVLSPDPARYTPVACLKARGNSSVGLVRDPAGHLFVARCLPITCDPALAATWPRLHHPGVQLFVSAVEGTDALWLLSEFVAGYPINEAVKLQTFSPDWVLMWLQLLLDALDFLHRQNMMLGRLRPSDVVLGVNGPAIVDLGYTERLSLQLLPQALTPFDPPECISSFSPTVQMDLFCVGAMASFMLTGSPPLASGPETRKKLASLQHIPLLLVEVVATMVHPLPAGRPASVEAVRSMLDPLLRDELPRPLVPPELITEDDAPAPWLTNPGPSREIRGRSLVRTLRVLPEAKAGATPRRDENVSLTPSPAWRPCAVLKRSTFSTVVLLEHRETKRLAVGRRLHLPTDVPPDQVMEACHGMAEKLTLLRHPRIPRLVEFIAEGPWYISSFTSGFPADQVHDEMDPSWVIMWITQLLDVFHYLHGQGIVLARLEPSDVVLGPRGAMLVDLRLFELLFPKTAMLSMLANQAYVAPERRTPGRDEPSQDLYSLAAVAWTLLMRTPPGAEDGLLNALREQHPEARPELGTVLTRMLRSHPSARYRSAAEVLEVVRNLPMSENDPHTTGRLRLSPRDAAPWVPEADWLPDQPAMEEAPKPKPKPPQPRPVEPSYTPESAPYVPQPPGRNPVWGIAAGIAGAALLVGLLVAPHHAAPDPVAAQNEPVMLTVSEGEVQVRDAQGWHNSNQVQEGQEMQSIGAQSTLRTSDLDMVTLGPETLMRTGHQDGNAYALYVTRGRLGCHVRHGEAHISLPGALVSCTAPSSAEFDLTIDHGRGCLVICRSGELQVHAALGKATILDAGESVKIFPSGMTAKGDVHPLDPWENWNMQQDAGL